MRSASPERSIAGHHPLSAPARTTSCRTGCMCCRRAGWRARAAPSLRLSLKTPATPNSTARPRRGNVSLMDLPVQQFRTKAEQAYLDLFDGAEKALPGARDPFVSELAAAAIETYGRLGLPHRRIEAWKYTDLRSRLTDVHPLLKADGVGCGRRPSLSARLGATSPRYPPIAWWWSRAICGPICRISPALEGGRRRGAVARSRAWRSRRLGSKPRWLRSIRATTTRCSRSTPR